MPFLICCKDTDISRVKLSVVSPCCNRRKIVFRINNTEPGKLEELFKAIQELLSKYEEPQ